MGDGGKVSTSCDEDRSGGEMTATHKAVGDLGNQGGSKKILCFSSLAGYRKYLGSTLLTQPGKPFPDLLNPILQPQNLHFAEAPSVILY